MKVQKHFVILILTLMVSACGDKGTTAAAPAGAPAGSPTTPPLPAPGPNGPGVPAASKYNWPTGAVVDLSVPSVQVLNDYAKKTLNLTTVPTVRLNIDLTNIAGTGT